MKGIILAGGKGTRLYPMTKCLSKQMLPVYDKPLIYYPLSTLLLAGIKDILIISNPEYLPLYQELLGDGRDFGVRLSYIVQQEPRGIAEAFILGEQFIGQEPVCLILGDNFFYGHGFSEYLHAGAALKHGAQILGCPVKNPCDFGIITLDAEQRIVSIEEKPAHPKSNLAIPGLYFFDSQVVTIAKTVRPSARGELEITSILEKYLQQQELKALVVGRGLAWFDTGTPQGLKAAADLVCAIQNSQGFYIACLEEIAYQQGLINYQQLRALGQRYGNSDYGKYILGLGENK